MRYLAREVAVEAILPWRDIYRREMNCQIIHDSLHSRPGWTRSFALSVDDAPAGYGSIAIGGPWKDQPSIFEFFVLPNLRAHVFDLFASLLSASGAGRIETQTNDRQMDVMIHTFAHGIEAESILFEDNVTTSHRPPGVVFRRAEPSDAGRTPQEWVVESEGTIAGWGGILFHYNRPYGDIYMEVVDEFRNRGIGGYLVQELKRVCYQQGSVPAARCNPSNVASRKTLQKAGFVPCGHIVSGQVSS